MVERAYRLEHNAKPPTFDPGLIVRLGLEALDKPYLRDRVELTKAHKNMIQGRLIQIELAYIWR